ncbi:translation initiation factor 2 [Sporosarcina sp. CAU 1771]
MNNAFTNQTGQNTESPDLYAARLTLIGSTLSTLGDALQAIAAGISLQELEKTTSTNQNTSNQLDLTGQLERMQKQIDHLARKIERMERRYR